MKDIASYYIKTLFLWKIVETKEKKYWEKGLSGIFRIMVQELRDALEIKNIRYFWHEDNNLIEKLKPTIQKLYVDKLNVVIKAIDANDVDKVVSFLLSTDEYQQFKQSEFYQKQQTSAPSTPLLMSQCSRNTSSSASSLSQSQSVTDSLPAFSQNDSSLSELVLSLNKKLDSLSDPTLSTKLDIVIDKIEKLDTEFRTENKKLNDKIDALMDKMSEQSEKLVQLEMMNRKDEDVEISPHEIRLINKTDKRI